MNHPAVSLSDLPAWRITWPIKVILDPAADAATGVTEPARFAVQTDFEASHIQLLNAQVLRQKSWIAIDCLPADFEKLFA